MDKLKREYRLGPRRDYWLHSVRTGRRKIGEVWFVHGRGWGARDNAGHSPSHYQDCAYGDRYMYPRLYHTWQEAIEAMLTDAANPKSYMMRIKAGEQFPPLRPRYAVFDQGGEPTYWTGDMGGTGGTYPVGSLPKLIGWSERPIPTPSRYS